MRTDEFDYHLPEELIAQEPVEPRDSSRLLICPRRGGEFSIRHFYDLPEYLNPGDIIVTNAAKVMPARLFGYKHPSGARIEVFLLERLPDQKGQNPRYKALLRRRRRVKPGDTVLFPESAMAVTVIESDEETGEDIVELGGVDNIEIEIEKIGNVPLPPYIKEYRGDTERYQTVFAKITGSVAAPTAGLHFTPNLLQRLEDKGVQRAEAHLRVGWGTFSPIRAEKIEDHKLHEEVGELSEATTEEINRARRDDGRVVSVGTTMTRLLETASDQDGIVHPFYGPTALYITPGYHFRAVDVLLTNFHLPRTSLLALVAAFMDENPEMGVQRTLEAYRFAVENRFRFYSFGDAMLII